MRYFGLCLWMGILGLIGFLHGEPPAGGSPSNQTNQTDQTKQQVVVDHTFFERGHREFKDLYFKQHEQEFVRLVKDGQSPQTLFIGCSDSRIVPDLILSTRPGDLFVIRTAGNFVPPYQALPIDGVGGTIQYAVEALNVRHIIVCGHSHCGAIEGLFKELPPSLGILQGWLKFGEQAKRSALLTTKPSTPKEELYQIAEQMSVIYQLEHLMTFPFIKKRVEDGTLDLHGWYYRIETGAVSYYDLQEHRFKPLNVLQPIP